MSRINLNNQKSQTTEKIQEEKNQSQFHNTSESRWGGGCEWGVKGYYKIQLCTKRQN